PSAGAPVLLPPGPVELVAGGRPLPAPRRRSLGPASRARGRREGPPRPAAPSAGCAIRGGVQRGGLEAVSAPPDRAASAGRRARSPPLPLLHAHRGALVPRSASGGRPGGGPAHHGGGGIGRAGRVPER